MSDELAIQAFDRDYALVRARRATRILPELGQHLAASVTVKQRGDGRGGKTAPPLPMNDTALAAMHTLYAVHADLCQTLALRLSAPSWRDEKGQIVGLGDHPEPGRVYRVFREIADNLRTVAPVVLLEYPMTDVMRWESVSTRTFKYATAFPREERPDFVVTPCLCGQQIVRFPPEDPTDEPWMVCSGCGRTYTDEALALTRKVALAVANHVRRARA